MKLFLVFVFTILLLGCSPQTPQSELNETIMQMLVLIEEGKSQELLAQYADLSEVPEQVIDVPEERLKRLKFALLKAKEMLTEFSESNTLAVYIDSPFKRPMKFIKVNENWLLNN